MEISTTNDRKVVHWVTVNGNIIKVIRMHRNGGRPLTITKMFNNDIGFNEGIASIERLINLEDEIFTMVAEHCDEH